MSDRNRLISNVGRRRIIVFIIITVILLGTVAVFYSIAYFQYRTVKLKFDNDLSIPADQNIISVGISLNVEDPLSPSDIWYYNLFGGLLNIDGFDSVDLVDVKDVKFDDLILDIKIEAIYIIVAMRDINTNEYTFLTEKVTLFRNTEITIKDIDLSSEALDVDVKEIGLAFYQYNIVWVRFSNDLELPSESTDNQDILGVFLTSPQTADKLETFIGGVINHFPFFTNDSADSDLTREWFQRLLFDSKFTEIQINIVINNTFTDTITIVSKKITVNPMSATEVIINEFDLVSESIDITINDLFYWVEPLWNIF